MFFVDGLFGIYLLFKSFSWGLLLVRIAVIVLGYKLAVSVAKLRMHLNGCQITLGNKWFHPPPHDRKHSLSNISRSNHTQTPYL